MIRIVLTTTGSADEAHQLARTLVSERLAACVNIIPKVTSVYKWKGRVEESSEQLLFIKTVQDQVKALSSRLREMHSYEVAEVVVLPVEGGSQDYLAWIEQEVRE